MSAWPDVDGAVRTWLRADTGVQAIAAQRCYFGVPKPEPVWPLTTVQRVGGGNAPGDAPVDEAQIQIDCWGEIYPSGNGNKSQAWQLARAVRAALEVVNDTLIATGVRAAIDVESVSYAPDPTNDRPRYIVSAVGSFWAV
jgi:hypothetical protein